METRLEEAIAAIRSDTASGATAIVARAAGLMASAARDSRAALESAARELCAAQPSMAGLRAAHALALRSGDPAAELEQFARRVARSPAAIARHAAGLLALRPPVSGNEPPPEVRLVTCSSSAAVEATVLAASAMGSVRVCCAESRPGLEGRALAARLAGRRVTVDLLTDAAISAVVEGAAAVLVGADAVGPDYFINKAGTGALCARAADAAVPVYLLAGREKFLSAPDMSGLELRAHAPNEVWADAPPGVRVLNLYFEQVTLRLVTAVVTDGGVLDPGEVAGLQR